MGWYARTLLPIIIDRGMRNSVMTEFRPKIVPLASKVVLEVGIGSGLNIPYYRDIERLYGLEPSAELLAKAALQTEAVRFPVDFLEAPAEAIPLADDSVDTVLSSWTLCTIPDVRAALKEMRRVLRPNGQFIFVEHGKSPEPNVQKWQERLTPVLTAIAGCHVNRKVDDLIAEAGFEIATLETRYLKGPKFISFHYIGQAGAGKP